MPQDFTGKVVAISGAASGMGLATAKYLYSLGALLSLTDVRQEALEAAISQITGSPSSVNNSVTLATTKKENGLLQNTEEILSQKGDTGGADTAKEHGDRIFSVVTDVRSSKQVDNWIDLTVKKYGRLDCCANLAGVVGKGIGTIPLTELTDADWAFVLDINLTGIFYALRAQLKVLQKGGSVVNAASTAGIEGNKCNSEYSASKHGVVGITRSAAKEVGGNGVRVNCIAPGVINTPMVQDLPKDMLEGMDQMLQYGQALHRRAEPIEVAKLIAFLLSDESSFVTGAVYVVDGGQVC